jgi:hypothetical protein
MVWSPGFRVPRVVPATAALMIVGLFHEVDEGRATAMAEGQSMTVEQVVREVMAGEQADVLRESVRLVVQELMELSELVGAELGERNPEGRLTQRNGYRPRRWHTRAGVVELQIPKLRQGSYFPAAILEPRKRGERALCRSCSRPTCARSRPGGSTS